MRLGFKFGGSWPVFSFRKVIRSERFWWEQQRAGVPAPQPLLGQGKKDWSQLSAAQQCGEQTVSVAAAHLLSLFIAYSSERASVRLFVNDFAAKSVDREIRNFT